MTSCFIDGRLNTNNVGFYFDYQNSKYGYNTSSSRGADTFHPFREPHTQTYTPTTRNASLDMGEDHTYRYVNTNSVPNTNSGTYTASSRGAALDMGATNSYRYVNTNSVPNSNSSEYTFPANDTGSKKDLGATNSYRYVTATNVYNKGKADGATVHSGTYTFAANDTGGTKDLGTSHTYRYVNASNVYTKGKADGKTNTQIWYDNSMYNGKVDELTVPFNTSKIYIIVDLVGYHSVECPAGTVLTPNWTITTAMAAGISYYELSNKTYGTQIKITNSSGANVGCVVFYVGS